MKCLMLRLDRIKVIDNREPIGKAEVKLLSFVTSEDLPLPNLDDYFKTNDAKEKKRILYGAAKQVLSKKELMRIDNIKDGHELILGDTGYNLLYVKNKEINSFNWQMSLVEDDQGIREFGQTIDSLINEPEFDTFLTNIAELASFAANPSVTLGIAVGKYVIGKVAYFLMQNKDDQLGIVYQSFYRGLDYPALDRKAVGIPDMTGNLRIDYRIYGEE